MSIYKHSEIDSCMYNINMWTVYLLLVWHFQLSENVPQKTDVCLQTFLINKLIKIQIFWNILYYWLNNASCKNFKKKINDLFVWVFFLFKSSQSTKNFMKIKVYGFTFCIADVDFTHVASYFIIGACCVVPVIHGITTEDVDAWTLLIVKSVRLSINEDVITIP